MLLSGSAAGEPPYRSPLDVVFSPNGKELAVTDRTAGSLAFIDVNAGKIVDEIKLHRRPSGLLWSDLGEVFVAEYGAGTVARVDAAARRVRQRYRTGPQPMGLALAHRRRLLVATDVGLNCVHIIDLSRQDPDRKVPAGRASYSVAVTPDESTVVAGNLLPKGPASDLETGAAVTLLDLDSFETTQVRLPAGSTAARQLAVSNDGRWAFVAHTIGEVSLPTIQLHHAWVNRNVVSVIDLRTLALHTTLPLVRLGEGAGDPWGVAVAANGTTLWVTAAGVHQLATIDIGNVLSQTAGAVDDGRLESSPQGRIVGSVGDVAAATRQAAHIQEDSGPSSLWEKLRSDASYRILLQYDLSALTSMRTLERIDLPGRGHRGLAVSPDGQTLAATAYFSGEVVLIEAESRAVRTRISLPSSREPDLVRRGEMLFHDATLAHQHWLSCATCHVGGGRSDGRNWDLPNDGIGNPKNVKSLLLAHKTPPAMATGIRDDYLVAIEAGLRHLLFREPRPGEKEAIAAYVRSLAPEASPHLQDGVLSEIASQGAQVFHDRQVGCSKCHRPPWFTDGKSYNVGTRDRLDQRNRFDTPSLVELWRTGPYLHHGKAVTVRDVVTTFNSADKHGATSHLSEEQVDALVAYLLSL